MRTLSIGLAVLGCTIAASPLRADTIMDLHGVTVGMAAADLPGEGYRDFACAGESGKTLSGWAEWKACQAGASGLRAIHAAYDQPGEEDTIVAGHPVTLTLSFEEDGRLARILIETDAKARLFLRKKAQLLGQQAKNHYGQSGWDCRPIKAAPNEEPIGPTLIKEECSKSLPDRVVTISRALFHKTGGAPKDFVSESRIEISRRPG